MFKRTIILDAASSAAEIRDLGLRLIAEVQGCRSLCLFLGCGNGVDKEEGLPFLHPFRRGRMSSAVPPQLFLILAL